MELFLGLNYRFYRCVIKICVETVAVCHSELSLLMQPKAFTILVIVWLKEWLVD